MERGCTMTPCEDRWEGKNNSPRQLSAIILFLHWKTELYTLTQVQVPDFGQPGWDRAAVLQLPRIRLQRELGHGGIFRRICCWWTSTDGDDFLGSSWHSANHVHTFSLNWRKSNWIQSLIIILPLQCQLLLAFCAIYFFRFTFIFGILLWMFVEINDLEWKLVCFKKDTLD